MSVELRVGALLLSFVAVAPAGSGAERFPESQVPRALRDWIPWAR